MRAVVQRVREAHVDVDGETVGRIGTGLLVLVGVGHEDDADTATALATRLVHLRIFDDESGRMNRSLLDVGGEMLVVSQFTLWGEVTSGRRPSWSRAAPGEKAEPLCREFADAVRAFGLTVAEGRFGASMDVHLVNQGPVTLLFT
ncbi:MAG: D-tyrosyl-tRNA(Tyr) deacylase [Deltaproteobacteria bacterium]|nr:D-tyrosyl-tRNA(Tyr) deacylase [Deltaproteobacteria bacterium]